MKTYSQKAASVFKIIGFVLLMPAIMGLIASLMFIVAVPWFTLIIWAFAGYGVVLLVKYFKHSSGLLPENKIAGMWIGTIVYNLVLLLLALYYMLFSFAGTSWEEENLIGLAMVFWWLIAVIGAGSALKSHWDSQKLP